LNSFPPERRITRRSLPNNYSFAPDRRVIRRSPPTKPVLRFRSM